MTDLDRVVGAIEARQNSLDGWLQDLQEQTREQFREQAITHAELHDKLDQVLLCVRPIGLTFFSSFCGPSNWAINKLKASWAISRMACL